MDRRPAVVVLPGQGHHVGNVEFLARSAHTPRFNFAVITIQPHRHTFANRGGVAARVVNVHAPAGFDLRLEED